MLWHYCSEPCPITQPMCLQTDISGGSNAAMLCLDVIPHHTDNVNRLIFELCCAFEMNSQVDFQGSDFEIRL